LNAAARNDMPDFIVYNLRTIHARPALVVATAMTDLLTDWSLEMTAKDIVEFETVAGAIPSATRISVTFLPGEDEDARIRAAAAVRRAHCIPVPHLSARRLRSVAELDRYLARLVAEAGVDHVFVVAGDLPHPVGPFTDALAIIRSGLLEKHGITHVGIAGYPEGHPGIPAETLWRVLHEKVAALRERQLEGSIITQFGFAAAPILDWVRLVRTAGIKVPVWAGVPGPANVRTLLRFAARCGVEASTRVVTKYGLSLTRLLSNAAPDGLLADITAGLDPAVHTKLSLHLYPFGGLSKTVHWVESVQTGGSVDPAFPI